MQRVLFIGHGGPHGFDFVLGSSHFTAGDSGLIAALERVLAEGQTASHRVSGVRRGPGAAASRGPRGRIRSGGSPGDAAGYRQRLQREARCDYAAALRDRRLGLPDPDRLGAATAGRNDGTATDGLPAGKKSCLGPPLTPRSGSESHPGARVADELGGIFAEPPEHPRADFQIGRDQEVDSWPRIVLLVVLPSTAAQQAEVLDMRFRPQMVPGGP